MLEVITVTSYKQLYFRLFNEITTALNYLEEGNVLLAIHLLQTAQELAEERCLQLDIIPEE